MKDRNALAFTSFMALMGKALGVAPKSRHIGDGRTRADARLKAKRIKNQEMAKNWDEVAPSRQVLRAESRLKTKQYRGMLKAAAMKNNTTGGAAVVR